jgi:hypothetical protein
MRMAAVLALLVEMTIVFKRSSRLDRSCEHSDRRACDPESVRFLEHQLQQFLSPRFPI